MVRLDLLKGALATKGVKQTDLSERLGMSRQAINNKLTGKSPLTVRDVTVICEMIDATPETRDSIFFADPGV